MSIQKYLLLKLCMVKKLEETYDLEQTAIFAENAIQRSEVLKVRDLHLENLSTVNKQISNQLIKMGVLSIKPKNNPLLYRIKRKIDCSMKRIEKKSARNNMMNQFIKMNL